jgi:hypothetical protein
MTVRASFPLTLVILVALCPRLHAEEPAPKPAESAVVPLPHADEPANEADAGADAAPTPSPSAPTDAPVVVVPALVPGESASKAVAPVAAPEGPAPSAPSVALPGSGPSYSPEQPAAVVSFTPAAATSVPARSRMGWFGVGLRLGTSEMHLAPSASLINQVNQASGASFTPGDFAIDSSAQTLTPTFHFGGSGYFFKIDLPFSFAPEFTTFGLGLYPVNVGFFVEQIDLFPYLSLGGTANVVKARATADPGTSNKIIGAIVEARAAIGVKYFPARGLAVSAEAGYAPWTAGIMMIPPSATPGSGANDATRMQGGTGSVVDFSLGLEWL